MTEQEIKNIIALGEGYQAEFKSRLPSKIREITDEICAFANAAGGVLVIGVDDANKVVGENLDNSDLSKLQTAIHEIKPKLHCEIERITVEGKNVIVIHVPSGIAKPYMLSGSVFIRMGPNTQKLTQPEELHDLFQQTGKIYFDEGDCVGTDETSINTSLLQRFMALAGLSDYFDTPTLAQNLQLIGNKGVLKNGAVLFFHRHPQQIFAYAVIRCVLFDGVEKRYILDDKSFQGSLLDQYYSAMTWLRSKLNISYDIEGQGGQPRKEIWEIPETVLKEALVNALGHRNYYEKGAEIAVEVYTDRIEISNPGGLVSAIPMAQFGKRSHSRNPLIFGLLARAKLVEKIGSGVPRMRALMREAGLPAPVFLTEGSFFVTFFRPVNFDRWVERWVDTLTENRIHILRMIQKNPAITKKELSQTTSLSASAIDKNIEYLKKIGLLSREGADRGGHWNIHFIPPTGG